MYIRLSHLTKLFYQTHNVHIAFELSLIAQILLDGLPIKDGYENLNVKNLHELYLVQTHIFL